MKLGEIIKKYCKDNDITYQQFADRCNVSKGYVSMLINGKNNKTGKPIKPTIESYISIAKAMNMTVDELFQIMDDAPVYFDASKPKVPVPPYHGLADRLAVSALEESKLPSNVRPISALHHQRVPMIGEVAAGEPIYAPEEVGVYVDAPVKCDAAITIKGDSMTPNYLPGDVVYIKCVPDVPEGAVAVVFLDDEATLKHVYKRETGLTLWSDNPNYMPMQIEFEDYANVRIFGVPVGFTRMFKPEPLAKVKKGFN